MTSATSGPTSETTPAAAVAPSKEGGWELETALVEVSHLLVRSSEIDEHKILEAICSGIGAQAGYLVTVNSQEALDFGPTCVSYWHVDGHPAPLDLFMAESHAGAEEDIPTSDDLQAGHGGPPGRSPGADGHPNRIVIPIISRQIQFLGYLGITHPEISAETAREHSRVLSMFGDLLASYYSRVFAERSLGESEERWSKLVEQHPDAIIITEEDRITYANRAAANLLGASTAEDALRFSFADFLDAGQCDRIQDLRHKQVLRTTGPLEHALTRLDGQERAVEAISTAIRFRGNPALQTVLRDVTERREQEERYSTFVQTIAEGVFRLDLAQPMPAHLSHDQQVYHIAEHCLLAECNEMMRQFLGSVDMSSAIGKPIVSSFPMLPRSLLDKLVRSRYRLESYEFSVPRREGGGQRHFSLNTVGRMKGGHLVRIWGSCMDITARVEMERRMVAVLEEQQERIGRDLHDGVGQLLTGVRMLSANLAERIEDAADPASVTTARKIATFAEEASHRVREICRGLAPPQISHERLAHSLEALATYGSSVSDTTCTFTWDGVAEVPNREAKIQLYRIAQEALTNTLKHADAANCHIHLFAPGESEVRLEIVDDGSGFDVNQHLGQSIGIYSMQRRANCLRAALSIESSRADGTHVGITVRADQLDSSRDRA